MDIESIASLLKSRKLEDRLSAVRRLSRSEHSRRTELLLTALRDRSSFIAAAAAEALTNCADGAACAAMTECFAEMTRAGEKRDPGCHVRANLAQALGRMEYRLAAEALREGLTTVQIEPVGGVPFDMALHLRANCALALGALNDLDSVRDVALLLFEQPFLPPGTRLEDAPQIGASTRKAAARALSYFGDPGGLIALAIKLRYPGDEPMDVIQECMESIVSLRDPRAAEVLSPYLTHRDPYLAAYTALMLARTGAPGTADLVVAAVQTLDGDALRSVILGLAAVRTEEAAAVVRSLASDLRVEVRLIVVEALASLHDADSVGALRAMAASDESARVKTAAREALEAGAA